MKRKKWTEAEELTLISAYADLSSSAAVGREKRLQPLADRVNSVHHQVDPSSFPFRWTWRDVSVKIHNMRHQYLGVKHKVLLPSSPSSPPLLDLDLAINLWPNFLRYQHAFGDVLLPDEKEEEDVPKPKARRALAIARRIVEVREAAVAREEAGVRRRMEEEEEEEEEKRRRWRRREERREEEEMEWVERMVGMQMEHEKAVLQMQADACQTQVQVACVLARVMCQLLGPVPGGGDAGMGGFPHGTPQGFHGQQDQGSMGENGRSDTSSPGQYM